MYLIVEFNDLHFELKTNKKQKQKKVLRFIKIYETLFMYYKHSCLIQIYVDYETLFTFYEDLKFYENS